MNTADDAGCRWSTPKVIKFTGGDAAAGTLQNPLFYAAKYGGFTYSANATGPLLPSAPSASSHADWDQLNNDTGLKASDGLPDNYFRVRNPAQLSKQLSSVFQSILRRVGSGTAAAVVANAREGEGAIYQALYEPSHLDNQGREVRWIGTLHALFVDEKGYLREDGDGNGALGDYTQDPAVELFFDSADRITKFKRYSGDPSLTSTSLTYHELPELRPIWNARDRLAAIDSTSIDTQRVYSDSAASGRYIITALDTDLDGVLTNADVVPFVSASFGAGVYGILNEKSQADAGNLVSYVRGKPNSSLRSRELDYANTGDVRTMRLGDIVNSTPTVVGVPSESFDLLYNDQSYDKFRKQYQTRRNVVYVGANDGMIHAFNAGFYNATTKTFQTGALKGSATEHPLGTELWAYVPYNLLPHLPWLADPDYNHVWYVDGAPRVFDARIFANSDEHPGGWGTLMVVGMRLGGASIDLARNNGPSDAFTSFLPVSQTVLTTRPAYVVLDITDPESPPQLVAEVTSPSLGYTTGFPTVAAFSSRNALDGDSPTSDHWYLAFGSGPGGNETIASPGAISSTVSGKLFMFDLKTKAFVDGYAPKDLGTLAPTSFVGDPVSVDWDLDFKADALYFGTVGGTAAAPNGKLFEIDFRKNGDESAAPADWTGPYVLVNPQRPIVSTPSVTFDEQNNRWVFAGTGRFMSQADKSSQPAQAIFGVIDYKTGAPSGNAAQYDYANFTDVTSAAVEPDGTLHGVTGYTSEGALIAGIVDAARADRGWKLGLSTTTDPVVAERSVTQTSLLGDILFASTFIPSNDQCGGEGTSNLYGLYYKTGAAKAGLPVFGTETGGTTGNTYTEVTRDVAIGAGLSASPSLHLGGARDQRGLTIFTQTSTGAIQREEGLVGKGAQNGEIDWREVHQ
ncbi:MAG: pilus assembly protein [Solimonas sp.]